MLVVGGAIDERNFANLKLGVSERETAEEKGSDDCGEREAPGAQRKSSAQRWSKNDVLLRLDSPGNARIKMS